MVLIIQPKRYYSSKVISANFATPIKMIDPMNAEIEPSPLQPDPIMNNIQKDTTVQDLGTTKLTGEGFKVYGGGNRNNKLRKFINLKI